MKNLHCVRYSTPLPDDAKVGDPVLLEVTTNIGSWRDAVSVRHLMLGNISHTTKTQFIVSVPGWESLRFNRRGGLRKDSADGCAAHKSFEVYVLDHRATGVFAIEDELDKNDPINNDRPTPTFYSRGVGHITATNRRIKESLAKAAELWGIVPKEWKNEKGDRHYQYDKLPDEMALKIAANPDAIEKLNDLYIAIGAAFGVAPKEVEE